MDIHFEIDRVSAAEWDDFVASTPTAHLLQTSRWGELKSHFGWDQARVAVRAGSRMVAGAQVLFHPLPVIGRVRPLTLAYVPKGPLVDFHDARTWSVLLAGLDELCRQRHAILLKIEPDEPVAGTASRAIASAGFRPSPHTIQPRTSLLIDLTQGLEACLAAMSPKHRYNIRLSERKDIEIHVGSQDDVTRFHQLATVTGTRDGFAIHDVEYYRLAYRLFGEPGNVRLFLATYEGRLLAGLMAFAFAGKAWYLYGASSNEERQRMPTYALQWAAMQWAAEKGCHTYDLWGIPDEVPLWETAHPELLKAHIDNPPRRSLWGIYRFKRGFGGRIVQYVGAYDRVYSPLLYFLYERTVKFQKRVPA